MQISEEQAQQVTIHERRIEQTRQAMGDTVSQLQHELSPGTLAGNAGNAVKQATVGRTGRLVGSLTDRVKANPIPAALMGGSLAWMWMSGRKDSGNKKTYYYSRGLTSPQPNRMRQTGDGLSSAAGSVGDQVSSTAGRVGDQVSATAGDIADTVSSRVSDAADQVSDTVGDVADSARAGMDQVGMQAQRLQTSFQRILEENPLPVALVAAGLGALIATAVPTHPAEERMLQPVGDQLSEQAKKVGEKIGQVADKAQSAARDEVQRQS
jgi:gas vesicle protein